MVMWKTRPGPCRRHEFAWAGRKPEGTSGSVLTPDKGDRGMTDVRARTETCRIHTERGVPLDLTVDGCTSDVPHHTTPAADVAEVLAALGYEVLGRACWVDRGQWILAVRRGC